MPVIAGFTHDESSNDLRTAKSVAEYKAAAAKLYGKDADAFLKLYPANTDAEVAEMGRTAAREGVIGRSMRNWAVAQTKYGSAPARIFLFSRAHPYIPGVVIAACVNSPTNSHEHIMSRDFSTKMVGFFLNPSVSGLKCGLSGNGR